MLEGLAQVMAMTSLGEQEVCQVSRSPLAQNGVFLVTVGFLCLFFLIFILKILGIHSKL